MSDPAVIIVIREHLLAVPGIPTVIMPNDRVRVSAPYLTFDDGVTQNTPLTIDGEEAFEIRPNIALHTEPSRGTQSGSNVLWDIAQAFKIDTPILSGGQRVAQCLQTPVPDGGELQGGLWRRNMILRIASYQTI